MSNRIDGTRIQERTLSRSQMDDVFGCLRDARARAWKGRAFGLLRYKRVPDVLAAFSLFVPASLVDTHVMKLLRTSWLLTLLPDEGAQRAASSSEASAPSGRGPPLKARPDQRDSKKDSMGAAAWRTMAVTLPYWTTPGNR
jgi:hypothetical protein